MDAIAMGRVLTVAGILWWLGTRRYGMWNSAGRAAALTGAGLYFWTIWPQPFSLIVLVAGGLGTLRVAGSSRSPYISLVEVMAWLWWILTAIH